MALVFDAAADALSGTTGNPTITSFTMMGWFYLTSSASYNYLMVLGTSTPTAYYAFYHDGAAAVLSPANSWGLTDRTNAWTGSVLSLNTWYHLAATVAGTGVGQFLGYKDGVLNVTGNGAAGPTNAKFWVGNNPDSDACVGMRAAAVKLYGAVLTAAEILLEMRQFLPVRTANLNRFVPMVDPTLANNYKDYSGLGLDLTAGGTLVTADGPPIPWRKGRRQVATAAAVGGGPPAEGGASTGTGMQRPVAVGWV